MAWSKAFAHPGSYTGEGVGGGTSLFGLYGDVPLDRVWFFGLAVLNRVYNLTCLCPKQGQNLYETGYGITTRETLTQTASRLFLFLACEKLG